MTTEITDPPTKSDQTKRWPVQLVWLGLSVTLFGFLSYFLLFYKNPSLRDFPLLNLLLLGLGVLLTAWGCWGMFKTRGWLGKGMASFGLLFALAITGLFNFYVFSMTYQLPDSSVAAATQIAAPDFSLLNHLGERVTLSDFHKENKKVVLVFYRGHW